MNIKITAFDSKNIVKRVRTERHFSASPPEKLPFFVFMPVDLDSYPLEVEVLCSSENGKTTWKSFNFFDLLTAEAKRELSQSSFRLAIYGQFFEVKPHPGDPEQEELPTAEESNRELP